MQSSLVRIALGLVVALLVVAGLAYLLRDPLATGLLGLILDRRPGLRCTHPDVAITSSLDSITVAALQCSASHGPIRAASTAGDTVVTLNMLQVQGVKIMRATLDQRERDISHVAFNTLGDVTNLAGVQDSMVKGMLDASALYAGDSPPVTIETLTMKRAGKNESVQHGFRLSSDGVWDRAAAARVERPGPDLISIRDLEMRVSPTRGRLTAKIYLSAPDHAGAKPDMLLQLDGSHLNRNRPYFELSFER